MEELIAELGAAFLCAELGITAAPRADHAGYIAHWLSLCAARHKSSNHEVAIMRRSVATALNFLCIDRVGQVPPAHYLMVTSAVV